MSIVWAGLVVVVVAGFAVTAMLLVRRGAPDGGYFTDGDRAAGVFGVLATGFSVLLGFVVFLAFTSYDDSKSGGETEALVVVQQLQTAQLMPASVSGRLTGGLVCYARSVVYQEWPRLESGSQGNAINPWGARLFQVLDGVEPQSASEQAAYSKWLDQTSDREAARNDRIHAADGVVPMPLWIVLFLSAGVVLVFILFFADRGERAVVQSLLAGSVAIMLTATLVLLWFLNNPYQPGVGGLKPAAMERSLEIMDEALRTVGIAVDPPCTSQGVPTAG